MSNLNLSTVPLTHGAMVGYGVRPRVAGDWRLPVFILAKQSSVLAKQSAGARKGIIP
jgi:hypothetical protein